jgi:hypothetical protein
MRIPDIKPGRPAAQDFSDITSAKVNGEPYWEPGDTLVLPLDKDPTEAELVKIKRRLRTKDAEEEALVGEWAAKRDELKALTDLPEPDRVITDALILFFDDKLAQFGE